jgi:hypothetical protein
MNRIDTNGRLDSSWLRSDWSSIRKVVLLAIVGVSLQVVDCYQAGGSVLNGLREHSRQAGATRNIFGPDKARKSPPTLAPAEAVVTAAAAATFGMVGDGLLVTEPRKGAKMMSMMARATPTAAPTPLDTLEPTISTAAPTTAETTTTTTPVAECPPSSNSNTNGMGMSGGKGGMGMGSSDTSGGGMGMGPKGGKGNEVIFPSDFPSIGVISSLIPSTSYSPAPVVKEPKSKSPVTETSKSKAPVTYAPTATYSPFPTFYPTTETAMPTPKPRGMMRGMMSMGDMKIPPPIPSLSPSQAKKSDKKGKGKMPKGVAPTTLGNATKVPAPSSSSSSSSNTTTTRAPQRRPSGNTTTRSPKAPAKAPVAPGTFVLIVHFVRLTRIVNHAHSLASLGFSQ